MTKQINPRCPFQLECERTKCEFVHSERDCGYYSSNVMTGSEIEDQADRPDGHEEDCSVDTVRDIDTITGEILEAKRVGGEAIITIGQRLIEAKAMLSHGEWLPWLNEKVEFSQQTANRFMRLAKEWTNYSALSNLGATKALQLLALPESEREEFLSETHQVNGEEKAVIDMTSRELEKAIKEKNELVKERDEARKAAEQAKAAWKTVEELRKTAREEEKQASDRVAELEKQLAELKAAPVDVAVMEVDQAQLDAARAEGEAHAEKKFKKARAEAQRQVSEANAATAAIKTELQQKQRELDDLQFELSRAKSSSSSPIVLDAEVAQFKLLFEHTQGFINQMHGLLLKVRGREDKTAAESMARAIIALGEAAKGAAQ